MAAFDKEKGLQRKIHSIENSPFRTRFETIFQEMNGTSAMGCISDTDPQPLLVRSRLGAYAICMTGIIQNAKELIDRYLSLEGAHFEAMTAGGVNNTELLAALISRKAPFVFSCFNQTIADMQVLTHELGHAFAFYRAMRHQEISELTNTSTDIAEIHSMSMEQFAYPWAERFFGEDADKFRFAHLQEALTFVPFGVAVDEFQHICYENPGLTPKERTWEWHKLEEKYMPWRRYDEDDEFMARGGYWYHKLHIYLYPMYYINYTLTSMGAMEFRKKAGEDWPSAWKDYLALCDIGGRQSYLETLKLAHLTVPFEEGAVARIIAPAKETLEKSL